MFVMRLLRTGLPLPGSEPRFPTTFVSVPYSDFLTKVSSNQVQKVEVDGVHLMFKLKQEPGTPESEISSSLSKMQESELLLRSVAPTKRIVYTTTRPTDIKKPYEKMLENDVEFGSPDKSSDSIVLCCCDSRATFQIPCELLSETASKVVVVGQNSMNKGKALCFLMLLVLMKQMRNLRKL